MCCSIKTFSYGIRDILKGQVGVCCEEHCHQTTEILKVLEFYIFCFNFILIKKYKKYFTSIQKYVWSGLKPAFQKTSVYIFFLNPND
jgi:hypothetical protein